MNNVLPGYIESFEIDEETRESIPMRRRGSVAEIAKTAAFLLSEDSSYITGQNIRVDGGLPDPYETANFVEPRKCEVRIAPSARSGSPTTGGA